MKTILFLLQKGQFSAVIGNKRCYLRGGESMSFVEFDSEKIVESFESSDNFKGWNDVQLFIIYDSESAKYLFNIIDGFELKNKVRQCKNFSFQIKLEEKSIYLKGDVSSFVKYVEQGDVAALAEIDQLKEEINNLKNEIKAKDETIKEINDTIKKLESANSEKGKTISELNKQVEKQKKDLEEWLNQYSESNFIDRGDYIELVKPVVAVDDENRKISYIKAITKPLEMNIDEAIEYAKTTLRLGGFNDWRVPTIGELRELYKMGWRDWYLSFPAIAGTVEVRCFYDGKIKRGVTYHSYTVCFVR